MKNRILLALSIALLFSTCQLSKKDPRPNIILIMSDDMGYSDIGCYGGEINTPNLDKLAAGGLQFTQFYNTARCCPTRASLLTGLYPQQAGIGHMMGDSGTPAYRGDLSDKAVTIAEVLKSAGYSTYMSGKWHVTPYRPNNPEPIKKNWPLQRGFDKFFGMISGAGSFYDPHSLARGNEYVAPREGFYATTDFTDEAIQFIEKHQDENPYFLYLAYTAAHWPMHAPEQEITNYKGKYDEGWDAMRQDRFDRMKKLGLINESWQLTPRDSLVEPWSEDIADREWELANMETYAAMVDIMDQGIGQIVEVLKANGELENTIIFFLQDNGACAEELEWVQTSDEEEIKPLEPGALQTKMMPDITRDGKIVKLMKEGWPGPPDGYTAYGRNWANASNTPFREYKHWVHEGGISTPLIVHWPAGIREPDKMIDDPAHLIDIMATCVAAGAANYPANFNEKQIVPMEGKSLIPFFNGDSLDERALFWEHEGNRAVRLGRWKLVSRAAVDPFEWWDYAKLPAAKWELFDMEADRTELHDLSDLHPEKVAQLSEMWMDWANRTGTVPRPQR